LIFAKTDAIEAYSCDYDTKYTYTWKPFYTVLWIAHLSSIIYAIKCLNIELKILFARNGLMRVSHIRLL
jgi:hypothetical protein